MLREQIDDALRHATKSQNDIRRSTLRLVTAAIKDRQIQLRGTGGADELGEADITSLLDRMIRQRCDSAETFEQGGREDLAQRERAEIEVIQEFLPPQLSEEEMQEAIQAAITETGAKSIRDMGRVMAALKAAYPGQMDFAKASAVVKAILI